METKKTAGEFPAALKEWREKLGLTESELARCTGISRSAISLYELGKRTPSFQAAEKLVKFGFQAEKIPAGKSYMRTKNVAMTDEERAFAEEHFNLVYWFMNRFSLRNDDWYDAILCEYLHVVQIWFRQPELHKYSFQTVAVKHMKFAVKRKRYKMRFDPILVSLDAIIPGTDNFTYGDMLCDPRDCVGI